ncbi:hypothetical protein Hamer_G010071 [Homarus americanus]|uniref:Uncharacterized protein n=1 Tax=Homarus americanus TaxID=6706 RepID=A0A8J5JJK6_HOMAM|nr:hypothetical protein Hamer_G010071 [Homarus americanus]
MPWRGRRRPSFSTTAGLAQLGTWLKALADNPTSLHPDSASGVYEALSTLAFRSHLGLQPSPSAGQGSSGPAEPPVGGLQTPGCGSTTRPVKIGTLCLVSDPRGSPAGMLTRAADLHHGSLPPASCQLRPGTLSSSDNNARDSFHGTPTTRDALRLHTAPPPELSCTNNERSAIAVLPQLTTWRWASFPVGATPSPPAVGHRGSSVAHHKVDFLMYLDDWVISASSKEEGESSTRTMHDEYSNDSLSPQCRPVSLAPVGEFPRLPRLCGRGGNPESSASPSLTREVNTVEPRDLACPMPPHLSVLLCPWLSRNALRWWTLWVPPTATLFIASDASDVGWGYQSSKGHQQFGGWTDEWRVAHINIRELYVAWRFLENNHTTQDEAICFVMDSTAAVFCLNRRGTSHSAQLLSLSEQIFKKAHHQSIHLSARHVPGIENGWADALSRFKGTSVDWTLRQIFLSNLVHEQGRSILTLSIHLAALTDPLDYKCGVKVNNKSVTLLKLGLFHQRPLARPPRTFWSLEKVLTLLGSWKSVSCKIARYLSHQVSDAPCMAMGLIPRPTDSTREKTN